MYPTADELLPPWLRVVGVVLLIGVVAVLALRAARAPSPSRWWHAAYAVMGVAMIVMYALNPMDTPGFNAPALLVFVVGLVLVVALAAGAVILRDGARPPVPWVIAAVDAVTLAYIQIPADVRPVIVCVLFACYLAVQIVLRVTAVVRAVRGAPERTSRTLVDPGGGPVPGTAAPTRTDVAVPIALAVLALAMLYMLSV